MSQSNFLAIRLLHKKIEELMTLNIRAMANGGDKVDGDMEATAMNYTARCAYLRALTDVIETVCTDVDKELRAHQ